MMGLDLKFLGPQLERAIAAFESMAESMAEMAATAKVQREILTSHPDVVTDAPPVLAVVGRAATKRERSMRTERGKPANA